jgi:hypothetical protein
MTRKVILGKKSAWCAARTHDCQRASLIFYHGHLDNTIDTILGYCGFDNAINRQAIAEGRSKTSRALTSKRHQTR